MTKTKTTIIGVIIFLMILILGLGSVLLSKNLQPLKISLSKKDNQIGSSVSSLASTSTLTASKPCSLLKVNTYEEYAKMKNTIDQINDLPQEYSWQKDLFLKLLDYLKLKISSEDYDLLEDYYQQFIANRNLDLTSKLERVIVDKYPTLMDEISDFGHAHRINYYADRLVVSDLVSLYTAVYAPPYEKFGDRDSVITRMVTPALMRKYYDTTITIYPGDDNYLKDKANNKDNMYTNRDIFFLTYDDLKDLTPQKLFETELCKIRYDIVNTKLENTTFNELEVYPFKYTLELGTEKTLMEIDNAIKNINTISDKEIYDYQKRFLQKLLSKSDPYSWRKDTEQIYKELKNLYEYKGTYSLYQSSELIQQRTKYLQEYLDCLDKAQIAYTTKDPENFYQSYTQIFIENSADRRSKSEVSCREAVAKKFDQMYVDYASKKFLTPRNYKLYQEAIGI